MKRRKKPFNSEKNARAFAKQVGGQFNDLRSDKLAKSKFSVSYVPNEKTRAHGQRLDDSDWCPEEGRDFGYPNEFWK